MRFENWYFVNSLRFSNLKKNYHLFVTFNRIIDRHSKQRQHQPVLPNRRQLFYSIYQINARQQEWRFTKASTIPHRTYLPQCMTDVAQSIDCRELYLLPRNTRDELKRVYTAVAMGGWRRQGVNRCMSAPWRIFSRLRQQGIWELGNSEVFYLIDLVIMIYFTSKKERGERS